MLASTTFTSPPPDAFGRFRVIRPLGKGHQSAVYLAYDPHLDRDVAIKTLQFDPSASHSSNLESLLAEARNVSRLQHPNIVTLFEVGQQNGQPFLVFEWVDGPSLAQVLQAEGPLSATRVAGLAVQILDALSYAHAQGIIHRDIKPTNILLNTNGVARVMDFGVAGRVNTHPTKPGFLLGTPAYMAPEYIRRDEFGPKSDLFSCGMMLYELLTGQHAVPGRNIPDVMRRIVNDPIAAPSRHNPRINDKLNEIIQKSLRKDPAQRYENAGQMKNALALYLAPEAPDAPKPSSGAKQTTLDLLLGRMWLEGDFLGLSAASNSINHIAAADKESVSKLSNTILQDFALAHRLLKLVNAAYNQYPSGSAICTVSRAVVTLGFDAVRARSVSLMLFDNMPNKFAATPLKEAFVKALYAGMLAREMAIKAQVKDAEEAFICSLFLNLGQLLAMFYFAQEVEEINQLIETKNFSQDKAVISILGLSYEELGIGVARSWGFPDQLVLSMRKLSEEKIKKGISNTDKLRVLSGFSNELCEIISRTSEASRAQALLRLTVRFGESFLVSARELTLLMDKAMKEFVQFAGAVNMDVAHSNFIQCAAQWGGGNIDGPAGAVAEIALPPNDMRATQIAMTDSILRATAPILHFECDEDGEKPQRSTEEIQWVLSSGLQDIGNSLIDDKISVNDILPMILETMYSAMGFNHVLFCLKDRRQNTLYGKFGFGEGVQALLKAFNFPLLEKPDVFHAALKNNTDILIRDIDDPKIASRIPAWYRQCVAARTFVLFPITLKGKPVGMIYADRANAGEIIIPEKELALLQALRNQAVLALRQSF